MMGDSSEEDYHSAEENEATDVRGPPREDDTSLEERLKTVRPSEGPGAVAVGEEQGETTTKLEGNGSSREHQEREEEAGDGRTRDKLASTNVGAVGGPQDSTTERDIGTEGGSHSRDRETVEGCGDGAGEFISGIDNRYVSEDVTMKGDKVELTEEQVKVRLASRPDPSFPQHLLYLYCKQLKLWVKGSGCETDRDVSCRN